MPVESIRILVIDDDADVTALVRAALESGGYEVLVADSGKSGLELAYTQHPHLILLDVVMPGMDGYQVCQELQFDTCVSSTLSPSACSSIPEVRTSSRSSSTPPRRSFAA